MVTAMAEREIELKLRLTKTAANKLRRHPALRRYRVGRGASSLLDSTYYDTRDLKLAARAMALRVRADGGKYEQTLKIPRKGGGLQTRGEWNAFLADDRPDLAAIDDAESRAWLEKQGGAAALVPVFRTVIRRTTWLLAVGGSDVELALDEGEIVSGDKREPILEAEFELKAGDPAAIVVVAREMAEGVPCHIDSRSKAERGYALFTGATPSPVKAKPVRLSKSDAAWDAFGAIAANCLEQFLANEPVIRLGDDPEGVHQGRVAIRRLRAAVSLFAPVLDPDTVAPLKDDLRRLQQRFGPARDWDVFIDETLHPMRARMPDEASLQTMLTKAEAARKGAYEQAHEALGDPALSDLVLRLEAWFLRSCPPSAAGVGIKALANRLLKKRWKKVFKAHDACLESGDEAHLHVLRIQIKKLRYAAEFFASLYPGGRIKAVSRQASALQDTLGGLNDAVVSRALIDALKTGGGRPVPAEAFLLLKGWQESRIAAELATFEKAWKRFAACKTPW